MDGKRRISIYDYYPELQIKLELPDIQYEPREEQIKKYFRDKKYRKTEYILLQSLYIFPYLTRRNMELYADEKLQDKKFKSYENIIKKMWQDGCIRRYNYDGTRFYKLTDSARAYMFAQSRKLKENPLSIKEEPADILEMSALAQWHLSVLRGEGKIKKSCFNQNIKFGKIEADIPSYIEFEKNSYTYRVFSCPLPKIKDNMEGFLGNISRIKSVLDNKNRFKREINLIVIVCAGIEEMQQCAKILDNLNETRELPIYFASEENTRFTRGLDLLYRIKKEDDGTVVETISLWN